MTSTRSQSLALLPLCIIAALSLQSCTDADLSSSAPITGGSGSVYNSDLSVSGGNAFHVRGPRGGPFPDGSRTYRVANRGQSTLDWEFSSSVPWLIPDIDGGTLGPGAQTSVTVTLDSTYANGLPIGEYPADIVVTDLGGNADLYLAFLLSVLDLSLNGEIELSPEDGLSLEADAGQSQGLPEGRFHLENTGDGPLVWSATVSEPWLELETVNATLEAGLSDDVQVTLDGDVVAGLAVGLHRATVLVVNDNVPALRGEFEVDLRILESNNGDRVTAGLVAEYRFDEASGSVVHDVSGNQPALDLVIENPSAVSWGPGSLSVNTPTLIATTGPATRLTESVRSSGALTVEAWIVPDNLNQEGPARLVSLSGGSSMRNFTLGQGLWSGQPSDTFNMRARHTGSDLDGMPILSTAGGSAHPGLQHVVYTRTAGGEARVYINADVSSSSALAGDFSNWDTSYRFGLANEFGANRPWMGSMHLVAVYERALSDQEIEQNFLAGSTATNSGHLSVSPGGEILFLTQEGTSPASSSRDYVLSNIGGEALNWRIAESSPWFELSDDLGSLASGASTTVTLTVDGSLIESMDVGDYPEVVTFTNLTDGFGSGDRSVRLVVNEQGSNGGGVKPGPFNTGPTDPGALTSSGTIIVTQAGAVIENVHVHGTVEIRAPNVTLRNFIIDGGYATPYGLRATEGHSGLVIEDGEIKNITSSGIYGGDFSAARLNIHESGGDAIKATSNVLFQSSWIHHLGTNDGAHADGDQTRWGSNFVFRGNNMDMPVNVGPPYKSNATFIVQTGAGPVDNFLIEGNWLNGGNFTVYFTDKGVGYGDPTNCRLVNNFFGRDYSFGTLHTTGYVYISGNRWEDNGELMDINNN
ncbi:MAG: hypothetical protein ACI8QC_004154 [Planctomycetota bacterium]|jgi:hypothetical protein